MVFLRKMSLAIILKNIGYDAIAILETYAYKLFYLVY